MVLLHQLSDFIDDNLEISNSSPSYYYQGVCPQTGELQYLPRTALVEQIAYGLMQHLGKDERYSHEGKMYGVLLIELPDGEQRILKAFSGLLNGCSVVEGWVPPISGRDEVVFDEKLTLVELEKIKQEIIALTQLPERQQYDDLVREFEMRSHSITNNHRIRKQQRQQKRQFADTVLSAALDEESRQDGIELKLFKRDRNTVLQPLLQIIDSANTRIKELKEQRKELSRQLQIKMHAAYSIMNFWGQSESLQKLMASIPTGTGDCCAPKLLHYSAAQGYKPLAMAEFWFGAASLDKITGQFYGACLERCQPLMGFLLSGLTQSKQITYNLDINTVTTDKKIEPNHHVAPGLYGQGNPDPTYSALPILYQDEYLIAVNKPAGLLSVPGRYYHNQDSVISRLRNFLPNEKIIPIHRLDQDTSGILLVARNLDVYRQISQKFQQRQIHKVYEAVLSGLINVDKGVIELPLWGNPDNRPYQEVNFQYGKPSVTHFQIINQVISKQKKYTHIEFIPLTGRTHQLRVHAADIRGLGIPILGDKLYGCSAGASRLHLHAKELRFEHSQLGKTLHLYAETLFVGGTSVVSGQW
jgi:tRNA pseudouridine32 synthase / 23S rRNA pseudouridine746 synthase